MTLVFNGDAQMPFSLTHISNPNGHMFIKEIEDEDNDEVDAGCGDGCGKLRGDERANQLDLTGGAILHDAGKCCINC